MAMDPEKSGDLPKGVVSVGEGDDNGDMADEEVAGEDYEGGIIVEELPAEVQRRIKSLKKNQIEITKIEAQFYKEIHELECRYLPMYKSLFEKRNLVISGLYEPTDEECDLSEIAVQDDLNKSMDKMAIDEEKREKMSGIPHFWAQIFQNVELLSDMVKEYDVPVIKKLVDIQVEMTSEPMGFKLHFYFSPNEFFTNNVLTKTYFMKCEVDMEDPYSFEGPEIVKCTGCTIDWVKGKNVTVKTIRKKQKHKQRGSIRTVTKTVEVPSFFNFFNPPQIPEDGEGEMDEDIQMKLTNDFEVGQYIRERIVPRAVLYYTGEALEDEEDDESYDEEEEEEEEEEGEDEDEGGAARTNKKSRGGIAKRGGGGGDAKPPECKQQ